MPEQVDLKKTINLPRTDFSMKANLSVLEPRLLDEWERMGLYGRIRAARKGRPIFVLHDGPPYANGHIHLGHALNKILKDLIVKSKTMEGFDSPYLPGWDCHGLPIEIKVLGKKKSGLDPLTVRQRCREYALKYVDVQRDEFKRLGIFGEWDSPYLTMSRHYEAETLRLLGHFVESGGVYKGLKPVHWCISCETALAEAEVEYEEHTSPSVYVRFPVHEGLNELAPELAGRRVSILIWTTTPWTLPANLALCFHPDFEYVFLESGEEILLQARERVASVAEECGLEQVQILKTLPGRDLTKLKARHPWLDRDSAILLGTHVTLEQGTGVVHTAPGHGYEDYLMGVEHGLDIYCPVDGSGRFQPQVEHFAGLQVFDANPRINAFMAQQGALLCERSTRHSYPHCWRCHNPVIFRATPQWFISMEKNDLRKQSLQAIGQVKWLPRWGEERISNMIATRPDWNISRQRLWGVPIAAFYCRDCREPLLSKTIIDHVAGIFELESADAWYARPVQDLIPSGTACACGGSDFEKEFDILDVWFDSGASQHVVLGEREDLPWPADVYLEGGDQYRGWFHSSLLLAVGARGTAPYRIVVCNGWTLDAEGRAMSKSLGNVISPQEIISGSGAEILRLWVASINYMEDVRLGDEIVSRLKEAYRKLRNTLRFLLGNLSDFEAQMSVPYSELSEIDRWALARTSQLCRRATEAYSRFEFFVVYHTIYNFCVVDLSAFYLDILKDRLYIASPRSAGRRAAQSTLLTIADALIRLLAPLLPFTSEEAWQSLYGDNRPLESVHLAEFPADLDRFDDPELRSRWERFRVLREQVNRSLEESRAKKQIGQSLDAALTIECPGSTLEFLKTFGEDLRYYFLVSEAQLVQNNDLGGDEIRVEVKLSSTPRCERCWHHRPTVGLHKEFPNICSRCFQALNEMAEL